MNKTHRRFHATICCTFLCLFSLWNIIPSTMNEQSSSVGTTPVGQEKEDTSVSLVPGELPGYTGWARLEYTLAGYFHLVSHDAAAVVGTEWTVTIECMQCRDGNAHFYARAYGPAVLAGRVRPAHHEHVYEIRFLPMDPGSYTVEVVLVSSGAPSWDEFPIVAGQEPSYEGFLLPGFPVQLQVEPSSVNTILSNRSCTLLDLYSESAESEYYKARWVVVDKLSHRNHVVSTNASQRVNLREYRSGRQSLGIFMDYRHVNCTLPSYHDASVELANYAHEQKKLHVVFVGDSVMRMQRDLFLQTFPSTTIQTTHLLVSGGLVPMMKNVTTTLQSLSHRAEANNETLLLFFNSGLHDVSQLCSRMHHDGRRQYIQQPESNFSCAAQYRRSLSQLGNFLVHYPAPLKVFQSTSAGWMRYGNYDIEWPMNETQDLALSSNMVAHFNDIAYKVISSKDICILDGYWMTLARPDNRQMGVVSNRGKHLVHPGEEVLEAMVRNLILVILQHLKKG